MTKQEFISKLQEVLEIEVTKKDLATIVDAIPTVVTETLKADPTEKVTLPGLGAFSVKHVPERSGVVMMGEKAGETWTKPAHDEIAFKLTKSVKAL